MIRRALTPYRIACVAVAVFGALALHHRFGELQQQHMLAQAVHVSKQQSQEVPSERSHH